MESPAAFVGIRIAVAAVGIAIWLTLLFLFKSRLESRDAQITLLERQRDDYKEKLDGASPEEARTRIDALEAKISTITENTENDQEVALKIDFAINNQFFRKKALPGGSTRLEVYVRIRNVGNGFLSECLVSLVDIKPKPNKDHYGPITSPVSLAKGEHRYILVASVSVKQADTQRSYDNSVVFPLAAGGIVLDYATLPSPSASMPALITVEATALGCRTEHKQFKLWVDEDQKLLMAEA